LLPISVNRCCSGRLRHRRCQLPRCRCSCSGLHAAAAACRSLTPLPLLPTSALAVIATVASLSPPLLPISAMLLMLLPAVDDALLPMSPSSLLPFAALPLLPVFAPQPQLPRSPRSLRCRCYLSPSPLLPISALPPLLPLLLRLLFWSPRCCCSTNCVAALPPLLLRLLFWSPRCCCPTNCRAAAATRLHAAAAAFSPLLPMSPSALLLHCCPTPQCGCYRRRSAANGADAVALQLCLSAARGQLEGLGFSPKAHPLPPLARTLCCLVLVGSPLNFTGYLLRNGEELRPNRTGF